MKIRLEQKWADRDRARRCERTAQEPQPNPKLESIRLEAHPLFRYGDRVLYIQTDRKYNVSSNAFASLGYFAGKLNVTYQICGSHDFFQQFVDSLNAANDNAFLNSCQFDQM
jgi:hypothetical protein